MTDKEATDFLQEGFHSHELVWTTLVGVKVIPDEGNMTRLGAMVPAEQHSIKRSGRGAAIELSIRVFEHLEQLSSYVSIQDYVRTNGMSPRGVVVPPHKESAVSRGRAMYPDVAFVTHPEVTEMIYVPHGITVSYTLPVGVINEGMVSASLAYEVRGIPC